MNLFSRFRNASRPSPAPPVASVVGWARLTFGSDRRWHYIQTRPWSICRLRSFYDYQPFSRAEVPPGNEETCKQCLAKLAERAAS